MKFFERATEDEKEKLSWAHRQHRVIFTPFLQACAKNCVDILMTGYIYISSKASGEVEPCGGKMRIYRSIS